jgi:anti-sigma B factor antagonist
MGIQITTSDADGVFVLRLGGRFDAHEVKNVREVLDTAEREQYRRVVVNLAGVNFIDSSGLAALVAGMKHCRTAGGDLHLCGLGQPLRVIFELTRLDRAFTIFPDEATARGAWQVEAKEAPPRSTTGDTASTSAHTIQHAVYTVK